MAPAGDERYLVCAAVAGTIVLMFFLPQWNCGFKLLWMRLCVCRYRVIWNLGLQIAVEWLHECCHVVLHVRRERRVGDVRLQNAL